jgi:Asp-tRNA(Asn)/Glu-tRNA(Gln) amidotransferase A subunit family amidase
MRARTLTCRALVRAYLDRIAAYDRRGPTLNSLIVVNPDALAIADSLDRRLAREGLVGPLHCVPTIVKDNFETVDLPTTAGSLALQGWRPPRDATMVRRLRAAGAIVLAKSNMAEWAFTPLETVSSILPGYTKNPYALDRVTAGSSGGTAAAVAASLGLVGLGTDTGNSIRGPSSFQALVGIRSTMGLTSRAGVVPLNATADVAGPMARTVADAVAVFQVVAGSDTADAVTAEADARRERDYAAFLTPDGLRGARIGVLRQAYERPSADSAVLGAFARRVRRAPRARRRDRRPGARRLAGRDPRAPPRRLQPLQGGPRALPRGARAERAREDRRRRAARRPPSPERRDATARRAGGDRGARGERRLRESRDRARRAPRRGDRAHGLAPPRRARHPTWSNPPRLIGDLNTAAGDNSQLFSPLTAFRRSRCRWAGRRAPPAAARSPPA